MWPCSSLDYFLGQLPPLWNWSETSVIFLSCKRNKANEWWHKSSTYVQLRLSVSLQTIYKVSGVSASSLAFLCSNVERDGFDLTLWSLRLLFEGCYVVACIVWWSLRCATGHACAEKFRKRTFNNNLGYCIICISIIFPWPENLILTSQLFWFTKAKSYKTLFFLVNSRANWHLSTLT